MPGLMTVSLATSELNSRVEAKHLNKKKSCHQIMKCRSTHNNNNIKDTVYKLSDNC